MTETTAAISVDDYLTRSFSPDVDYVNGRIEERNVGEREHGLLQFRVAVLIRRSRTLVSLIETRLRVAPQRYRVPDVCVYKTMPTESVLTTPPLLCIEIVSPEDRLSRVMDVADDYLGMGVQTVWILDPLRKRAYVASPRKPFTEVFDSISTLASEVVLDLADVFSNDPF